MYPHHDGPPVIYGAHGQPLGPIPPQGQDPNYGPQGYAPTPYPGVVYDDRGGVAPPHPHDQVSRKRPRLDDSLYPSPISQSEKSSHPYPSQQRLSTASGRRGSGAGGQYEYPDPTGLAPVSPASSTTSYQSAQYPQAPQPYYPPSVRRSPPQPTYSYEGRASTSPHGSTSSAVTYPYYAGLHPPQVLPPAREAGRTPPPATSPESNGSRAGMSVRDMLGPGDGAGGRTSADSDMLNALNKRGM
ncbi:MAG: hypothetical protein MMC33_003577 [Icmadophila ericetorum]|nr:hypothetical protein [Icmadophila ericetorum]